MRIGEGNGENLSWTRCRRYDFSLKSITVRSHGGRMTKMKPDEIQLLERERNQQLDIGSWGCWKAGAQIQQTITMLKLKIHQSQDNQKKKNIQGKERLFLIEGIRIIEKIIGDILKDRKPKFPSRIGIILIKTARVKS